MSTRTTDSRWRAVALGTVLLLVASILPSPLRRHEEWAWVGPDKALHLLGHAGYALSIVEALATGRYADRDAAVLAVCLSTVHSLVTCRLQRRVPGRACEPADVLAGLIGAVLAVLGWLVADDVPDRR
jgi:VanZ family protein